MRTKAAVLVGPGEIVLEDKTLELAEDEVLVRTHRASICGTDKNLFRGLLPPWISYPVKVFGHEGSGIVEAVGSKARDFQIGDEVMSFGETGCFAPYFKAKDSCLYKTPRGLARDLAHLGEPAACAIYSVFQSGIQLEDVVAVVGLGFAGQIMVRGAKKKGAGTVIGIDLLEGKTAMARELGADIALNPEKDNVKEAIADLTQGRGVDVAFEAAGTGDSINLATSVLKDNGILALYSWSMEPVTINISRWHHHAIDIRTTCIMHRHPPHERDIWVHRVLKPVETGMIRLDPLVTHEFKLAQIQEAFQEAVQNPMAVKIAIVP